MAQPGQIIICGGNGAGNRGIPDNITSFPGFPSSFSGFGNANLVVNPSATGIIFVPGSVFALQAQTQYTQNGATGTTELVYSSNLAGSLPYNGVSGSTGAGDCVITQTGWYNITATVAFSTAPTAVAGQYLSIAVSNGNGGISSTLCTQDLGASAMNQHTFHMSCDALLTLGNTVGVFYTSVNGTGVLGNLGTTQFSIKLIS